MSYADTIVFRTKAGRTDYTLAQLLDWINDESRPAVRPMPMPERLEYAIIYSPGEPEPYLAYTYGADFSGQGATPEAAEEMLRECIAVYYEDAPGTPDLQPMRAYFYAPAPLAS